MRPAHQNGHVPTGTLVPSGQPNNFIEPCRVNSRPKMIRKMLRTGEEKLARRVSKVVVIG